MDFYPYLILELFIGHKAGNNLSVFVCLKHHAFGLDSTEFCRFRRVESAFLKLLSFL